MAIVERYDHEHARVLVMNRPEVRNAMSSDLLRALLDALAEAVRDDEVAVIVLTGAGGSFSAGADLREQLDHDSAVRRMELFCHVYEAVAACPKPTIAAIDGACVGGGAEVAAACDLRIAGPDARFRFPGAALGISVGPAKLIGLVGLGAAKDLVLTSRTLEVDEAVRLGLVQRASASDDTLDVALDIAGTIAGNHQRTVAHLKRQFLSYSGLRDRVAAENDTLMALAEAGGDYDEAFGPGQPRLEA